jgi:hypothetical protein
MNNSKVISAGEKDGQIILEIIDGEFEGTQYIYKGMKFADDENSDGTINMSFEYEVIGTQIPEEIEHRFGQYIGQVLYEIMEEQVAKGEAVYTGGTDDSKVE